MPGIAKLIHQNEQQSIKSIYRYEDIQMLRRIIDNWQKDLTGINKCFLHVVPDEINLRDYNFYQLIKT